MSRVLLTGLSLLLLAGACTSQQKFAGKPANGFPATPPPEDWTQVTLVDADGQNIPDALASRLSIVGNPPFKVNVKQTGGKFALKLEDHVEYKMFVFDGEMLIGSGSISKGEGENVIAVLKKVNLPEHETGARADTSKVSGQVIID